MADTGSTLDPGAGHSFITCSLTSEHKPDPRHRVETHIGAPVFTYSLIAHVPWLLGRRGACAVEQMDARTLAPSSSRCGGPTSQPVNTGAFVSVAPIAFRSGPLQQQNRRAGDHDECPLSVGSGQGRPRSEGVV